MIFPADQAVPLWSGAVPFSHGTAPEDIPTICAYYPQAWRANGRALLVFPGGAYWGLADHEGSQYAKWLAQNGYTAFVVQYRTAANGYHHPVEISDAARAVRLVRANAAELGLRPNAIGVIGSSAGGHLAASVATLHELGVREAGETADPDFGRPDFTVLCYPVISAFDHPHEGSFVLLLNDPDYRKKTDGPARRLSMELAADAHTPPAFIWHTWEDQGVPVENSLLYAARLRALGIRCELHIYEKGPHGIGLADGHPWCAECLRWMGQF